MCSTLFSQFYEEWKKYKIMGPECYFLISDPSLKLQSTCYIHNYLGKQYGLK